MVIHAFGCHRFFDMETLLKVFRPAERFTFSEEPEPPQDGEYISAMLRPIDNETAQLTCRTALQGEKRAATKSLPRSISGDALDREISTMLYPQLCDLTGISPPWGMLTGIRPVTLLKRYLKLEGDITRAAEKFQGIWQVTPTRTALATEILTIQQPIFSATPKNAISVYLSIPFCPTRCRYCSFVSNSTAQMKKKLLPDYLQKLHKEIELVGTQLWHFHVPIDTLYVGGGTPTILEATDLDALLQQIDRYLMRDENGKKRVLREYCVEAGRPDTITREKLRLLLKYGVTRISVNPQSFQDTVLAASERPHTAQDAVDAYQLAREVGFQNINMDFIAGLPADTAEGFRESLQRAVSMQPENITVHCLALKKAANLYGAFSLPPAEMVSEMVDFARELLKSEGYRPYYLYRQKNMAANLENVGYAKPGYEGVYNILMMDDSQSILGIGAGACTKLLGGKRGVNRVTECKYPYEYLARYEELMEKKEKILNAFFSQSA